MDQERDIREFIKDSGVHGVKTVSAPMPNKDSIMQDPDNLLGAKDITKYQSDVGSLNYFVCWTLWQLAHPVSRCAQFNKAPT